MLRKKYVISLTIFCASFAVVYTTLSRSPLRSEQAKVPQLSVSFHKTPHNYQTIRRERLEVSSLFELFDQKFFQEHLLPADKITYRDNSGSVSCNLLRSLIENLLKEIKQRKKEFTDFTVLTQRNFNKRSLNGLLILKFKNHPFVLKLFIENPESFIDPYSKGIESIAFFSMGGGINRHLTGFTRIKNLEVMQKKINESPRWANRVVMPRKWFWLPQKESWLKLEGHFFSEDHPYLQATIPAIYGIVADEIHAERIFSLFNKEDTTIALEFCNFMNVWIDPHIDNFMIEKGTQKIAIVDTEHFLTLVGIKEPIEFKSYFDWYKQLVCKYFKDNYGYTKSARKQLRTQQNVLLTAE